jgi:ABC-type proline/glycine betaine transport system permease subunit
VRLGLRSAPSGLYEAAQGMGTNPQGYFIITPMKLNIG